MGVKQLLGMDLDGRLRSMKRRFGGDVRVFDHQNIHCHVTPWSNGHVTFSAGAFCSDPNATGLGDTPFLHFYKSPAFQSVEEAMGHATAEVRRAAEHFPGSRFTVRIDREEPLVWSNGGWAPNTAPAMFRRCPSCGFQSDEAICPECAEPIDF